MSQCARLHPITGTLHIHNNRMFTCLVTISLPVHRTHLNHILVIVLTLLILPYGEGTLEKNGTTRIVCECALVRIIDITIINFLFSSHGFIKLLVRSMDKTKCSETSKVAKTYFPCKISVIYSLV